MSTARRDFLKIFSGGMAGAAALFAGKRVGAELLPTGVEDGELPMTTEEFAEVVKAPVDNKLVDMRDFRPIGKKTEVEKIDTGRDIVRIAHNTSQWVREGKVEAGNWFSHKYLDIECQDVGPAIEFSSIWLWGFKAMRFDRYLMGAEPEQMSTNPKSKVFKAIVSDSEKGQPHCIGCCHGPVYIVDVGHTQFELFCHNKSLRHFAQQELGPDGVPHGGVLRTRKMVSESMGFTWYTATVQDDYTESERAVHKALYGDNA